MIKVSGEEEENFKGNIIYVCENAWFQFHLVNINLALTISKELWQVFWGIKMLIIVTRSN